MTRFRVLIAAVVCAFILGAASAQTLNITFLPSISNGQAPTASICDGVTPLNDSNTGAIDVMRDENGKYIVAWQNYGNRGRAEVAEHVGNKLVGLSDPVRADEQLGDEEFSPPGAKQGDLALVPGGEGAMRRFYYTQREQDDTPNEGPYLLWCMGF